MSFFDLPDLENSYIIISMSKRHCNEIVKQLDERQYNNFVLYDVFGNRILPIIAAYKYNKSYMNLAQIVVTERCTLKCRKCAHGCYAVDNKSKDMPLSEVKRTADIFFSKVDYIEEFVLIGGEPLLYNDLAEAVDYIADRYFDHIGVFSITTNGTIIPKDGLLKSCSKHHVLFRISNYITAIPRLKEQYKKLCDVLENNEVEYILQKEDSIWIDYGFDYLNDPINEKRLTTRFDSCQTPCRDVRDNRLYFCVQARTVSDNLKLDELDDDFLNLTLLSGDNWKKKLLEFSVGYSKKGYLTMCHRCHGMDAINYPIPAAEQM